MKFTQKILTSVIGLFFTILISGCGGSGGSGGSSKPNVNTVDKGLVWNNSNWNQKDWN